VADSSNNAVRRIDVGRPGNVVTTLTNEIMQPYGIVIDKSNLNLFVSSNDLNLIYKVSLSTKVATVYAGTGGSVLLVVAILLIYHYADRGYLDGYRLTAQFSSPSGLSIDKFNNIYVADLFTIGDGVNDVNYHSIRLINSKGNVTTMAGRKGSFILKTVFATKRILCRLYRKWARVC